MAVGAGFSGCVQVPQEEGVSVQGQIPRQVGEAEMDQHQDGQAVRVGRTASLLPADEGGGVHARLGERCAQVQGAGEGAAQTSTNRPQCVTPSGEQASQGVSLELIKPYWPT